MKLIDVLRKECVKAGAKLNNKTDALQEVVRTAKESGILKNVSEHEILEGLKEREELGSTGFGKGIAIPHCRLESVSDFVIGIITIKDGVDFEALDKEKVNLIIFIIAPEKRTNEHLKVLSSISQTLLIPGAVKEILAEEASEGVYESFLRHTYAEIDSKKQTTKIMLNVFVQNEDTFREILEKLAGIETGSVVVTNAENAGAYLGKLPLFASFWRDESSEFCKIITAILDKGLTNEAIRRVESVTGDLNEKSGVMVTVQDVAYAAGWL